MQDTSPQRHGNTGNNHLLAEAEVPLSDFEIQRPSGRPLADQTGREERVLVVSEYTLGAATYCKGDTEPGEMKARWKSL